MKNKGFMLIETLIASTIILGALIFLFIQFSAVKRGYENSFKYNTIPGLYKGRILSNFLNTNGYDKIDSKLNTNGYFILSGHCPAGEWNSTETELCDKIIKTIKAKYVIYVSNNIMIFQDILSKNNDDISNDFDVGFKKFILSLDAIEKNQRKRIIIEYDNDTYAVISL